MKAVQELIELNELIDFINREIGKLLELGIQCVKVWYEPELRTIVIKPDIIPQIKEFHEWLFNMHSIMLEKFPEYDIVIHGMEEIDDILYPEIRPPLLLRKRIENNMSSQFFREEDEDFTTAELLVKAA